MTDTLPVPTQPTRLRVYATDCHDISAVVGGTRREIAKDLDWHDYRTACGLNPSSIVNAEKSMLNFLYWWNNPRPDTDDFLWGRAVHCLLYEPRQFEHRYRCWIGARRGNAYKDFVAECFETNAEVLTEEQMESAMQAAKQIIVHPKVRPIIAAGLAEVTLFHPEFGLQCRGRVDWISTSTHCLSDLKTTKDVGRRACRKAFGRDFFKFHYDIKLGLYRRWLDNLTGEHWPVQVIAVEKTPPYDVSVMPIPEVVIDRGAEKGLALIERIAESISTGQWPGIDDGEDGYLDVPPSEMDEELEGAEEVQFEEYAAGF